MEREPVLPSCKADGQPLVTEGGKEAQGSPLGPHEDCTARLPRRPDACPVTSSSFLALTQRTRPREGACPLSGLQSGCWSPHCQPACLPHLQGRGRPPGALPFRATRGLLFLPAPPPPKFCAPPHAAPPRAPGPAAVLPGPGLAIKITQVVRPSMSGHKQGLQVSLVSTQSVDLARHGSEP